MVLTGFELKALDQEGNQDDGKITMGFKNAEWQQNRIDLNLNYHFDNYGFFARLQAQSFGYNLLDTPRLDGQGAGGTIRFRNLLAYANFLDDKIKVSTGWLCDFLPNGRHPATWEWLWETEIINAESFRFTGEDHPAIRAEFKPIEGLNFGFQYFFVGYGDDYDWVEKEAWKEIGIGATYNSRYFRLQAGVRLDSKADGMSRDDFRTYLTDYYGDVNLLNNPAVIIPAVEGESPAISLGEIAGAHLKHTPGADYGDGHYAFFGLKLLNTGKFGVVMHGGLFGLGAFDKFGYGQFAEQFTYDDLLPKLRLGLELMQEFYGADVWPDDMKNSPFLQFTPYVSYQFPKNLTFELRGTVGMCPDVLDSYVKIKPKLEYQINSRVPVCSVQLFYEMTYQDYTVTRGAGSPAPGIAPDFTAPSAEPRIDHVVGVAVRMFF